MKITIQRDKFREAFRSVARVVPARTPKPVLQNIHLTTTGGGDVRLVGTDLECSLQFDVANCVTVEMPGDALIPAARFSQILDDCKDDAMTIESVDGKLKIAGNRSRFNLPTEKTTDFPRPAFECNVGRCVTLGRSLGEAIGRTAFACDTESSRYQLGGVYFDSGDGSEGVVRLVATNGRHMVAQELKAEVSNWSESSTVIVPADKLRTIRTLCESEDGTVEFWADRSTFYVRTSRGVVSARLTEGRFPDWRRAMPSSMPGVDMRVPTSHLLACIKQASVVCDREQSRGIDWLVSNGTLRFSSESAFAGQSDVELPVGGAGEGSCCMDFRYTIDYLSSLGNVEFVNVRILENRYGVLVSTDDGNSYMLRSMGDK